MKRHEGSRFLILFLLAFTFIGGAGHTAFGVDFANIPIVQVKKHFLELYQTHWELFGVNDKLDQMIDEAMDEQIAGLMWGTVGLQLGTNRDGIVDKIQEAAGFKFSPVYENFVAELEDAWSDTLKKDILDFYEETSSRLSFSLSDNPMAQAQLRHDYDVFTGSQGNVIINDIMGGLSEKYHVGSGLSQAAIGTGLLTIVGKKFLQKKLLKLLGRKAATTAAGKIAGAAIPIAGWIMLAWGAWDVYSMAIGAEDTVRQQLHDMNRNMYSREIPLTYWEAMEPYVRDAFILSYEKLQDSVERSDKLNAYPALKRLRSEMNKAQDRFFVDRVVIVEDVLDGYTGSRAGLYEYFGTDIRDASVKDFETLVLMLREGEWGCLKEWFDFISTGECCELYRSLSQNFWAKLPPEQDSLMEISRLSALPKGEAEKELALKPVRKAPKLELPETEQEPEKAEKKASPPALTGLDKSKFSMKARASFMSLCGSLWEELMMPSILRDVVNKAIENQTKDLMWGTVSVQLRMNADNIVEKIHDDVTARFAKPYEDFLTAVEEKFGAALQDEALNFYKKSNLRLLADENNPMRRAEIRLNSPVIRENRGKLFKNWLDKEHSWASLSVSDEFFSMEQSIYANKLPELIWGVMEPYVTKAFVNAYGNVEK